MRMLIRLAILLNAMVYAGSLVGPQSAVAEDQIHWQSSPQQAAAQAADEHKLVLLHFTANWCGPCQTQKRFVFSNPTVAQAVHQSVVPVLVDIDINRALAGELGVKSIPFDVFLTPQGEVVSKRNSPTDSRNFIQMVSQLPAPQAAPKSGALAKLAELKRRFDPMGLKPNQRGNFGAEASEVASVGVSKEAIALGAKSNYGDQMSFNKLGRKSEKESGLNPELQAMFGALERKKQTKKQGVESEDAFFEIPASRKEQAVAAVAPATNKVVSNPASPQADQRRLENMQRQAFLARERPAIEIPVQPTDVKPVRIMNENFLSAQMNFGSDSLKTSSILPGLQVSDMVDSRTGKSIEPGIPSGRTIARIKTEPEAPQPSNQMRILPRHEDRIAGHAVDGSFPSQATLKRGTAEAVAKLVLPGSAETDASITQKDQPAAQTTKVVSSNSTANSDFCLQGKCPVALALEGKWVDGDPRWGIIHRDRTYLFSSEENYRRFQEKPDYYSPILAAYDPVAFHDSGNFVDGLEENGIFMEKDQHQQIVLFSSEANRQKFQTNPQLYMGSVRKAIYAASRTDASNNADGTVFR